MNCEDRIAIVTGAAGKGIGRSIALTLAREGARVVVNYRTSADAAMGIVEHIERQGGRAMAVQADVNREDECQWLVDAAIDGFGRIDICVIGPGGGWHPDPIEKLNPTEALADAHKELAPLYNLMPLVLPHMFAQKWGRLIGLSLLRTKPSPSFAYDAGKAARTHAMLRATDAAWAHNVTVNVMAPGPVGELDSLEDAVELCAHGPKWIGRKNVTPQDIAESAAMLCSEAGRFVTGCEVPFLFH